MNYIKIRKVALFLLASTSSLSASLTKDAKTNNESKLDNLQDEYNIILNGKIETFDLWNLRRWLWPDSENPYDLYEKSTITAEANKAIKLIKQQPSLVLNQSKINKRNMLMYIAVTGNIKQLEEILDSLSSNGWNNKWEELYKQKDIGNRNAFDHVATNYILRDILRDILKVPENYKKYKRDKMLKWWAATLSLISLCIGLGYWALFSKKT